MIHIKRFNENLSNKLIDDTIPFSYNTYKKDRNYTFIRICYDVIFFEDFGIFKKGDEYAKISIDYNDGEIDAYNENNKIILSQKYKTIPFVCDDSGEIDDDFINDYYDVKFAQKFGNFKKGDEFTSINIDFIKGVIIAFDSNGDIVTTQKYKATPI